MTTQERLRETAKYLRTQYPRPFSQGVYVDELMLRAADEMDDLFRNLGSLAERITGTDNAGQL